MYERPPGLQKTGRHETSERCDLDAAVEVVVLARRIPEFLYECEYRGHSPRTLEEERAVLGKLLRYLQETDCTHCGGAEIRRYLNAVSKGEMQRAGRWGQQSSPQPVRPRTVRNHWSYCRTFFNWMADEYPGQGGIFDRIKPPIVRPDQIQPFTEEQIKSLRSAARRTLNALRDEAIVLFLLDTGVRASELCAIRVGDIDLGAHHCSVLGKGNKRRLVYFGRETKKALWKYLQDRRIEDGEPLFLSVRGILAGEPLTRAGLAQMVERLGKAARLNGVRCSPHTFRHTMALRFLNSGGNMFALQQLLGHTHLAMTQRYLNLADADLEAQARRFSPVDSLKQDKSRHGRN